MITNINVRSATLAALCSTLAISGACTTGEVADPESAAADDSAASAVYAAYQAGSRDRVRFEVTELEHGALAMLAGRPINDLVGVPDYWLRGEQDGTEIGAIVKEARSGDDEWQAPIDVASFAELGHRLDDGRYALLGVRMQFEGGASEHRALQVCFDADRFCTIMDPVVLQLSAFADNRARLLAEGWSVKEELVPPSAENTDLQGRPCTLNSNPRAARRVFTKPAKWVEYKNVFGGVLVRKDLGAQEYGISCYVSNGQCRSSGVGYSNQSSCYGRLGWRCACANTGNLRGTTGNATKAWSETRCTHKYLVKAAVSFSVNGKGADFNLDWQGSGGVDAQGGQIYDSCSFH
jgi:hypothetical protein